MWTSLISLIVTLFESWPWKSNSSSIPNSQIICFEVSHLLKHRSSPRHEMIYPHIQIYNLPVLSLMLSGSQLLPTCHGETTTWSGPWDASSRRYFYPKTAGSLWLSKSCSVEHAQTPCKARYRLWHLFWQPAVGFGQVCSEYLDIWLSHGVSDTILLKSSSLWYISCHSCLHRLSHILELWLPIFVPLWKVIFDHCSQQVLSMNTTIFALFYSQSKSL